MLQILIAIKANDLQYCKCPFVDKVCDAFMIRVGR